MNIFWHLVWLIPLLVMIGVTIGCFMPHGHGPKGPPYVGFHVEPKATDQAPGYAEQATAYQTAVDPGSPTGVAHYKPGDLPGAYVVQPGSEIHRQIQEYQDFLLGDLAVFNDPIEDSSVHPGMPCAPTCWRKPDGHLWKDEMMTPGGTRLVEHGELGGHEMPGMWDASDVRGEEFKRINRDGWHSDGRDAP